MFVFCASVWLKGMQCRLGVNLCRLAISAARLLYPGDLNRSTQHLLILLDKEVADGDVTDIVHGEAEG
jgi:hypothetical protein